MLSLFRKQQLLTVQLSLNYLLLPVALNCLVQEKSTALEVLTLPNVLNRLAQSNHSFDQASSVLLVALNYKDDLAFSAVLNCLVQLGS